MKLNFKILAIFVTLACIIGIFLWLFFLNPKTNNSEKNQTSSTNTNQGGSDKIISTKPDPLNGNIIPASEPVEITFSESLQNSAETRIRIDPEIEFKIELSSDRKTAKIVPKSSFPLGTNFTLFISPETKFDNGTLGEEIIFRFSTVKFKGL